jgi:hypothetical protein
MATNLTPLIGLGSAFGGASSTRGNTGPFWVGSGKQLDDLTDYSLTKLMYTLQGLAILSALITLTFIRPLSHDGMVDEDTKVCLT